MLAPLAGVLPPSQSFKYRLKFSRGLKRIQGQYTKPVPTNWWGSIRHHHEPCLNCKIARGVVNLYQDKKMTIKKVTIGALVAFSISASVLAHGGATGIVKERMDAMSAMGDSIKKLVPVMQGKAPYDPGLVRDTAALIGKHSGETLTKLFPAGSGGGRSDAKVEIWDDWEEFSKLANRLKVLSQGLGLAADNGLAGTTRMKKSSMMGGGSGMGSMPMMDTVGLDALAVMPAGGVFAMVSQTCSACHTKFRIKK